MFRSHRFTFATNCIVVIILLGIFTISSSATEKETYIRGHVWAVIKDWGPHTGMGDRFQHFVFGVESKNQQGNTKTTPVLIIYLIPSSDDTLPKLFFDYSNLLELRVNRLPDDVALGSVALIKYMTADDQEARPPDLIMRLLDGAPTNILKMDMVLPYYELFSDGYRCIDMADEVSSEATEVLKRSPAKIGDKARFYKSPESAMSYIVDPEVQ